MSSSAIELYALAALYWVGDHWFQIIVLFLLIDLNIGLYLIGNRLLWRILSLEGELSEVRRQLHRMSD
jgi:hypothetical protein